MRPRSVASPAGAAGFVLAGGRSTRMGTDKALLAVGGRTLLAIALERLRALPFSSPPRIAGSRPGLAAYAPVIEDTRPGCGPLGGVEAALAASGEPLNLFLPVDLPLAPAEFLGWMLRRARISGALATYPRAGGIAQPVCAVYHRSLLPFLSRFLDAGVFKVSRVLEGAVEEMASREQWPERSGKLIDVFDLELVAASDPEMYAFSSLPLHRWFQNCNTPEDLQALRLLASRQSVAGRPGTEAAPFPAGGSGRREML